MRIRFTLLIAGCMTACSSPVADYKTMTPAQKQAFMKKYEKDMAKVHSLANRMGKMKVIYQTDASTDTISSLITMDMDMKGSAQMMGPQMEAMFLEMDCKASHYKDFMEAGITMKMKMVDKNGKTIFRSEASPQKCAKYLA